MLISKELLCRSVEPFGLQLSDEAVERFDRYAELLVEWNGRFNLTAITDPDGIVVRHFADSLAFLAVVKPAEGSSLIDVGSGAGFPGLPIAIQRGDMKVTLLDSTNKRVGFLAEVARELGLSVTAIHARAEDAAAAELREQFDLATARAVANMRELSEYCLGFVKVGGKFAALKGPSLAEELADAQKAVTIMGGGAADVTEFLLPDGSSRTIAIIPKIAATPTGYPRKSAKMAKFPLK